MLKSRIEIDPFMGRNLLTTQDVRKGDLVVEETPFALGPKQNSGIVCLNCFRYLQFGEDGDSLDRCDICDWPLCSACADSDGQEWHDGECEIFSQAKVTFAGNVSEDGICTQLDCITPLRVLLAKEADPGRWDREIACMEFHDEQRRELEDVWHADRVNIALYLRGPCKLADRFSEDLIMQVVGILEVNAFEARTTLGYPLRCLYPTTGILAHNCVPNTARSIYPSEGFKIRLRAMTDLTTDQPLLHSYTFTLNGTAQRQEHIKAGKFFNCECERCKDPTELGTNFSTLKCTECENGWILSTQPLDTNAEWKCESCKFVSSSEVIETIICDMQTEVADLQTMTMGPERLQKTEKLLEKYSSIVHPLHFIQTGLRQSLIEMYGRVKGYEMVDLPEALLERKAELCRQVLQVLDVFEPGLSRTRAMVLYELHVPLVLLAKSAFISGALTAAALKLKLLAALEILCECVNILKYEDEASQEGVLGQVAQQALEQLGMSIDGLDLDWNDM